MCLEVAEGDYVIWSRLAVALARLQDVAGADLAFSRARQHAPNEAWRWYFRSVEFLFQKRMTEAVEAQAQAKRLSGREDSEPEWAELNLQLLKPFCPREIVGVCERLTRIAPEKAASWKTLGYYLSQLGRHAEAAEAYRRCIALDPDDPAPYLGLLWVLWPLGRLDERLAVYAEYLRRNPGDAKRWAEFASALGWAGRRTEEAAACQRLLELQPENSEIRARLGWLLMGGCEESLPAPLSMAALQPLPSRDAVSRPLGSLEPPRGVQLELF